MRPVAVVLIALAAGGLAACGGADREAMLNVQISACAAEGEKNGVTSAKARRLCDCAINRIAAGKNREELAAIFGRSPSASEREQMGTCVSEDQGKSPAG